MQLAYLADQSPCSGQDMQLAEYTYGLLESEQSSEGWLTTSCHTLLTAQHMWLGSHNYSTYLTFRLSRLVYVDFKSQSLQTDQGFKSDG